MEAAPEPCTRCGEPLAPGAQPDAHGWCARCRAGVVRASTRLALLPAALVALGYGWLLLWADLLGSRFVVVWLALGAAIAWAAFKVARRAAFDVLGSRGVR